MIANIKRYAMRNINLNPMAQQTAVEWLAERVVIPSENGKYHIEVPYGDGKIDVTSIIKQAKQMEKEHIVEAFYEGMKTNPFDPNRGRGTMYYNETYKKQ
jgi:hypothetical protein